MIVTMAYDEDLANRIRELIASEDGYTEQKMFGGIGFMIDGHMAVGVSGEGGLMIHCSEEETEALLAKPGARPFEMCGREMKGWLRVDAESVCTKRALEPGDQVIRAPAEDLPFEGGCFDATLAQLVVNVMDDPVAGLREMARVTRDGGVVAACVWDFTDGGPIGPFWDAAQALDPEVETGSVCPGSRAGHLADLFRAAGIGDIVDSAVAVDVEHATFEDWWEPSRTSGTRRGPPPGPGRRRRGSLLSRGALSPGPTSVRTLPTRPDPNLRVL